MAIAISLIFCKGTVDSAFVIPPESVVMGIQDYVVGNPKALGEDKNLCQKP